MKIKALLTLCLVTAISLVATQKSTAQEISLGDILEPGVSDANRYLQEFTEPAILSFANGMGNGWYNTAKPHKLLGLDLTFSLNMASIPDEEKFFTFNNSDYQNLQLQSGTSGQLPTLVGGETTSVLEVPAGATITSPSGESVSYDVTESFNALNGFNLDDAPIITGVPVPTLQLGIGLIKNTDLKLRLVPEQTYDDFSISMFGIGVMHDIKQWIPGMKLVPIDISGFVGYTSLTSEFAINITESSSPNFYGSGTAEFSASATTIQILASKKLLFFTPYVGIGFNAVGSELNINGDYRYVETISGGSLDITDPVALEFTDGGGPRVTVGGRIKLLVLTIHADYTAQKYSTFTMGVGLSIR